MVNKDLAKCAKNIFSALFPYTLIYIVMWQIGLFCVSMNPMTSGTWDNQKHVCCWLKVQKYILSE